MKTETCFKPTLYQHLATDYRRNLAVTAGAGTGKTEVLTRRIIKILGREKHRLDRLLVLTFTDKAAVEMKDRIYRAIERESSGNRDPHFIKLKDTFLENYISTFHAFCAALLREYPVEAEVDPYFRVLDETEQIFFLRRSINRSLRELAANKNDPDIGLLSEDFSRAALAEAVYRVIQRREDCGSWVAGFGDLRWEEYRVRLELYRSCVLREIICKLHAGGVFTRLLGRLRQVRTGVEDGGFKVDQKLNEAIFLLGSMVAELERWAGHERSYAKQQSAVPAADVRELVRLKGDLLGTVRLTGAAPKCWPEDKYAQLKDLFGTIRVQLEHCPVDGFELADEHERLGFEMLQALNRVTAYCLRAYQARKGEERYLDFQDLQLKTEQLLTAPGNALILEELRERFQYIMVDEFQDTNDLQWRIIKLIATTGDGQLTQPGVFVVGDEKQAIYSFRGGDVRLFSRVRRELREANRRNGFDALPFDLRPGEWDHKGGSFRSEIADNGREQAGEIVFADNFRSAAEPIRFFNLFFHDLLKKEIYEEYDARPQLLRCAGNCRDGTVELLLVDEGKGTVDNKPAGLSGLKEAPQEQAKAQLALKPHFKEALLIADRIREMFASGGDLYRRVRENAASGRPAVAILLNRRTMIKSYEEALRLNRISFSVFRGRGFFQRREIVDLGNLLTVMIDRGDERALCAFLRSAAGHVSDEAIFMLARTGKGLTLWEKLVNFSAQDISAGGFNSRDRRALDDAASSLRRWHVLSRRLPLVHFLRLVLDEGGYYVSLGRGERGGQALSNLEKLLDSARDLALQENMDLPSFAEWLNNRIDHVAEEGEADIDIISGGSVQIMTVHQAKGLEFPAVFVPDLGAHFNLGENETLYIDEVPHRMQVGGGKIERRERFEIGLDVPNPQKEWETEPNLVKRVIRQRMRERLIAEKRRLLYVACTRAMDHLFLVGSADWGSPRLQKRLATHLPEQLSNWLDWLNQILGISGQFGSGRRGAVHYFSGHGKSMSIPYRVFREESGLPGADKPYRTEFAEDRLDREDSGSP